MKKVNQILQKIKEGKNIRQIATEERVNRYSISLVKQTVEIYEQKIKELENEIQQAKQTIQQLISENKKLKKELSELKRKHKNNRSFYITIGFLIGIFFIPVLSILIALAQKIIKTILGG